MNYLTKIFIGACVVCTMILGITFLVAKRQRQQRSQPILYQDNINQLKELCRTKYQQSLRYLAYANFARRDSAHLAAELFNAMSHADAIHHTNCQHAIEALGGKYTQPLTTPTQFSHTTTHLKNALHSKITTHCNQMPLYIEQALSDNNRYIARMLTWCDASDVKQILLLNTLLNDSTTPHHHTFKVCPTCGDITWESIATRHCPKCMTDSAQFVVIKLSKE